MTTGRIYRRTEAGRKAWDTQNTSVALEYRRVLGSITGETDCDAVRAKLGHYSQAEILELLAELEQQGLLESYQEDQSLDFTASLKLAEVQQAQKSQQRKADDDLDFTSELNLADIIAAVQRK